MMDEKNEILIIDDDEGTRKTLTFILKKKGFDVVTAGTGEEGLRLAHGRKISVALLDINLPDIEGIQLIAPLKEMHPGLSVIMITGFASMENAMRALNEGATGYVLKPVKIDEILSKIQDALERQHLIKNKQQAEEALRASEEKYRNLVENLNDIIYALDERGVITYISPAVEKITGYLPSQILGQPFTGFILKDDLPGVLQTFEAIKKSKVTSFPFRIVTKSGDPRWLNSSSYPSFANGELSGVQGVLSDITERKRAEEALQKSEEKFRDIFDKANDAIEIFEVDDHGHPGRYIDVNDVGCRMLQYSKEEMLQHSPLDFDITDYNKPPYDEIGEKLQSAGNATFETGHKRKDGEVIPVEVHIHIITLLGKKVGLSIVRDISERKLADDALRASEHRHATLLSAIPDMMFVISRDGVYSDFSVPDKTSLAVPADQIIGKNIRDTGFKNESTDAILKHIAEVLDTKSPRKFEYDLPIPAGVRQYEARLVALSEDEVLGIVRDITERRRAENALRESEDRYRQLVDNTDTGFVVIDDKGTVIEANEAYMRLIGAEKSEEVVGHSVIEWTAPGATDSNAGAVAICARQGFIQDFETVYLHRNGSHVHVIINATLHETPIGNRIVSFCRNITERKMAEEALRESEQKFRDIFNNANDAIELFEIRDNVWPGRYIDVNEVGCRMLQYTKEEMLQHSPLDFDTTDYKVPPNDEVTKKILSVGHATYETGHKRKDGKIVPVEINFHVITLLGKMTGLSIVRDITERRMTEELQRRFTEELELQVKTRTQELEESLNEKVILLREIHHRVKNNLQIIISLVNLQMRKLEDPQLKQVMAETQNRVRAMSLVHEKLYQSESLSRIDFADYTRFLTTQLMSYYRTDTSKVRLDFAMDTIFVDINTAVPLGILMNELISNALKHAFLQGQEGTISIGGGEVGDLITLFVRDNGIGIPEEFDWKNPTSVGMGLVNTLIDQIDGTITLDRENGTTFTLTVRRNPANGGVK
ncbi:MAG: PAS domain S-box protein [Methanoregula sp.]|nr:PAS domain S-box protein [Methanoregula sp.]